MINELREVRVSVIIPTYNRPVLVERTIRSVLNQTYGGFEIVVMDDSNNDETGEMVKKISDERIKYFKNKINFGFSENKNQGVKNASPGVEYIAFLDDDDEYLPQFLERVLSKLDNNREIFAATTYAEFKTQSGYGMGVYPCECDPWRVTIGNGWVLRRSIFFADNIWFDKSFMSEDLDFGIAVSQRHRWICIPEVLRIYYGYPTVSGGSHSTSFTKKTPVESITGFLDKNLAFYKASGPKALAWVYLLMGKMLMRAGHVREGRVNLRMALQNRLSIENLFYYIASIIAPKFFRNLNALILKNKILGLIRKK